MKADAKPADESEKEEIEWAINHYQEHSEHDKQALEWAINFFRGCDAELKEERRPRDIGDLYRLYRRSFGRYLDKLEEHPDDRDRADAYADYLRALGAFSAARLERGDKFEKFSERWQRQIIALLRNPNLLERKSTGPSPAGPRKRLERGRWRQRLHGGRSTGSLAHRGGREQADA
jgi:hypothetical protein